MKWHKGLPPEVGGVNYVIKLKPKRRHNRGQSYFYNTYFSDGEFWDMRGDPIKKDEIAGFVVVADDGIK